MGYKLGVVSSRPRLKPQGWRLWAPNPRPLDLPSKPLFGVLVKKRWNLGFRMLLRANRVLGPRTPSSDSAAGEDPEDFHEGHGDSELEPRKARERMAEELPEVPEGEISVFLMPAPVWEMCCLFPKSQEVLEP